MLQSPLQFYRDNEGSDTPAHKTLDSVLIRIHQSPPIHHVCLRNSEERRGRQVLRVERQLLDNPLCGAAASLGWPLTLNIETSAVNKGGYGLQLHPSKWRHYMWKQCREESRIVCQQSHQKGLLHVECHSSTSACHSALTAQTSLCSQFHCATNRELRCIMPSCYSNDVQIIFVQGSPSMAKTSHGSALQCRKGGRGKDSDMTHRAEIG